MTVWSNLLKNNRIKNFYEKQYCLKLSVSEKYDSQIKVADSNKSKKYDNDKSKPMALIIFPHILFWLMVTQL